MVTAYFKARMCPLPPDRAYPQAMQSNPSRDQELEDVVDRLEDGVTEERQAQGLPGNIAEREQTPAKEPEVEPPD